MTTELSSLIHSAFEQRADLSQTNCPADIKNAIMEALHGLNDGSYRVATQNAEGHWIIHDWLKKAILLYFKTHENRPINAGFTQFFDKVPLKYNAEYTPDMTTQGARIVPGALVRFGSYIAKNTVLMPSYVNIGAYVDEGTMVDTWATVGSCAQIGKNVHLSGGVGIGGVLEPLQANPTIIEDNCFIGARSEVVEGVIVERGSVIAMGVFISQSTPLYHRETDTVSYGRVPAGSVVIPGSLPASNGKYSKAAAIIVKQVDEKTRAKTAVNDLLREAGES